MATINDLPNELLQHIFDICLFNRRKLSLVCHRWNQLMISHFRLVVGLYDDVDTGERDFLRRISRPYRALRIEFNPQGRHPSSTEVGDRTGLWVLRRFPHATEVMLTFKKYCSHRILKYLNGLGEAVRQLTIFTFDIQCDCALGPDRSFRKVVPLPNLRFVYLLNLKHSPEMIYNWFQRKAPNIQHLKLCNCAQADVFIGHFSAQLRKLEIMQLFTEINYNYLKCPQLTWFKLETEAHDVTTAEPIHFDAFLQNAPQIRHFQLLTNQPCYDLVRAVVRLPNLEFLTLELAESIPFDESDKLSALETFFFESELDDIPQLPALRYANISVSTSELFYSRLVTQAPNITHLDVAKDTYLTNETIVTICTGLTQLTGLFLRIHHEVTVTEEAFKAIPLLKKLRQFWICFDDITQERWLGEWFRGLAAPTVTVESMSWEDEGLISFDDFKLLLSNPRTRRLTVMAIRVKNWLNRRVCQEATRLRPELQFFYKTLPRKRCR